MAERTVKFFFSAAGCGRSPPTISRSARQLQPWPLFAALVVRMHMAEYPKQQHQLLFSLSGKKKGSELRAATHPAAVPRRRLVKSKLNVLCQVMTQSMLLTQTANLYVYHEQIE